MGGGGAAEQGEQVPLCTCSSIPLRMGPETSLVGSCTQNHLSTSTFLGPKWLAYRLDAISQGPKNSRIPGPNPLPLALVMDLHASKTVCTGLYISKVQK